MLKKIDLSDLVLVLGAGGVIAYLWRNSLQENTPGCKNSRLTATNFMNWLFDEETFPDEFTTPISSGIIYNSNLQDNFPLKGSQEANSLGLNVLSSSENPKRFLKHRLFDISQLRDTSRFKNRGNGDAPGDKSCVDDQRKHKFPEQIINFENPKYDSRLNALVCKSYI